jgi:hypothetical protein
VELRLQRRPTVKDTTFGDLYIDGQWQCYTLEDALRAVKLAGRTAIPAGRYRITLETSPKFGPNTITVNDVPNFRYIRIHAGNDDADTEGCPLVGRRVVVRDDDGGDILESRLALGALKRKIIAARNRGEEVWITVVDPA